MKHSLSPKKLTLIVLVSLAVLAMGAVYVIAGSVIDRVPRTEVAGATDDTPAQPLPPADRPPSSELAPVPASEPKPAALAPTPTESPTDRHGPKPKEENRPETPAQKPKPRPRIEIDLPF